MLSQLQQLKSIAGVERLNFAIQFTATNKATVVLTSQVQASATGDLAELLRKPIVISGSLNDIEIMLVNELLDLSEQVTTIGQSSPQATASNVIADTQQNDEPIEFDEDDDEESL